MSQPNLTGRLIGMSLLRLYSNDITGLGPGPLSLGGAVAAMHWRGKEWKPEYKSQIQKHTSPNR
jgi:hypothetical protein